MSATEFLIVDEHVARNPIARAIAKRRIDQSVRVFTIRVYMLRNGEQVASDIQAAAKVMTVAIAILEQRGLDDPVIRGGISCCTACARRRFAWHEVDAVAIAQALRRANDVYQAAGAVETQRAFALVTRIERQAVASLDDQIDVSGHRNHENANADNGLHLTSRGGA